MSKFRIGINWSIQMDLTEGNQDSCIVKRSQHYRFIFVWVNWVNRTKHLDKNIFQGTLNVLVKYNWLLVYSLFSQNLYCHLEEVFVQVVRSRALIHRQNVWSVNELVQAKLFTTSCIRKPNEYLPVYKQLCNPHEFVDVHSNSADQDSSLETSWIALEWNCTLSVNNSWKWIKDSVDNWVAMTSLWRWSVGVTYVYLCV